MAWSRSLKNFQARRSSHPEVGGSVCFLRASSRDRAGVLDAPPSVKILHHFGRGPSAPWAAFWASSCRLIGNSKTCPLAEGQRRQYQVPQSPQASASMPPPPKTRSGNTQAGGKNQTTADLPGNAHSGNSGRIHMPTKQIAMRRGIIFRGCHRWTHGCSSRMTVVIETHHNRIPCTTMAGQDPSLPGDSAMIEAQIIAHTTTAAECQITRPRAQLKICVPGTGRCISVWAVGE